MDSTIVYRKYNSNDFNDLLEITKITWEYENFLSEGAARIAAEFDLIYYLKMSSFIYVAETNNRVVGFIIGRTTDTRESNVFNDRISQLQKLIKKQREWLMISAFRWKMGRINKKLYKNNNHAYPAELQFFAIKEDYRGLGIGKELFQRFNDYLKSKNIDSFYLYTDTTCNYKFYDYYELMRRQTQKFKIPFTNRPVAEFYLYDNIK